MELSTMQPCQSETSNYGDETVPSSPPAETPKVRFAVPFSEELFPGTFEARVAPVLKAETGFSSYEAYLRENGPRHLQPPKKGPVFRYVHPKMGMKCAIIDMSKEKHLPPKVSLRCADYSVTQTFMVLREPPRGVSVRVVLCSASGYTNLAEFRNVFGVGMQLARQFFDALLAQLTRHSRFEVSNNARFRCKYLLASGTVVAVARHFALAPHESPPIVLVAGPPGVDDLIDEGALNGILNDGQRKESLLDEDFPSGSGEGDSSYSATFNYARLLSASMKQDPDYIHSCDELLLGSLIPLLQFDILRIRRFCSQAREYFVELKSPVYRTNADDIIEGFAPNSGEDDAPDELYRYRTILRSVIEQFEDETEPLKEFISSQIGEHMTSSLAYSRTEEDRKRVLREASRLEAEIRDYVQVQAGKLALLESRKSIELSSYQIQEGKRVKIFTILAFVYVPLNLATSVFGMNLQQLNGNGKSVGDFITTAVVALVLTGSSWWLMEQLNSLLAWRKRGAEHQHRQKCPHYSITVRLTMLAWLILNGHWSWMRQSGAGWHILINSGSGYRKRRGFFIPESVNANMGLTAGDFVTKFANENNQSFWFDPNTPACWTDEKADKGTDTDHSA